MYCEHCQKEFPGTGKFCPICGQKLKEKDAGMGNPKGKPPKRGGKTAVIILIVLLVLALIGGGIAGVIAWMDYQENGGSSNRKETEETSEEDTRENTEEDTEEQKEETSKEEPSKGGDKDKKKPHEKSTEAETESETETETETETEPETEATATAASSEEAEGDYILPQSSSRLLTEEDIQGMTSKELNYARNEIFARYGRRFVAAELQAYFDSKDWYEGTIAPDEFDMRIFSEIERSNITFLEEAEAALGVYYPK